jgi:7-cyano-7-deazaguanine synthase in queuosine biosynthesis
MESMTEVIFNHEESNLPNPAAGLIPVLMYGASPPGPGTAAIGNQIRRTLQRLRKPVHATAFDFLTVALAVTAADTFVSRSSAADGWVRDLRLTVPVNDATVWQGVLPTFEKALRFLSGDSWTVNVVANGPTRPVPMKRGAWRIELDGCDSACLFSGGLDSAIGALDLRANGRTPMLVSHSYRFDGQRQESILGQMPAGARRFAASAHPVANLGTGNDVQMRTRSLNFLAYGAMIAATLAGTNAAEIELFVPENGLIALNPPLTPRRIGALSTRTTHPHFLAMMQDVFDGLRIPARIVNPYAQKTKGEMIKNCVEQAVLHAVAGDTVSCGKWKRTGLQCGKCVPCLIRRASFHAAGWSDPTAYAQAGQSLIGVLNGDSGRDDVLAMVLASRRLQGLDIAPWVTKAGPLPPNPVERTALLDVVRRGMGEVGAYLASEHLL